MMLSFTDQLNRNMLLSGVPKRIISVVPSQTELLADLGLEEEVIGITKFCVHPDHWFRNKTHIGGTKKLNLEKIRQLQPDLIIGNKEENEKEQLETLMQEFPVWVSDVNTLPDALDMIKSVGEITGKKGKADRIAEEIDLSFKNLKLQPQNFKHETLNVAYFIWRNPWMVAGGDTFIHEMLRYCHFKNCFEYLPRYPEISLNQLTTTNCQLVFLSSEPFPFKEKHVEEIRKLLPEAKILLVDGEMFSWYGSRLLKAPDYFRQLMEKTIIQ